MTTFYRLISLLLLTSLRTFVFLREILGDCANAYQNHMWLLLLLLPRRFPLPLYQRTEKKGAIDP